MKILIACFVLQIAIFKQTTQNQLRQSDMVCFPINSFTEQLRLYRVSMGETRTIVPRVSINKRTVGPWGSVKGCASGTAQFAVQSS